MTPERMMELKNYVNNLLEREDICWCCYNSWY